MVSKTKRSWEKFKCDVEGWTASGVEQESWGKRSASKADSNERLLQKHCRITREEDSFKKKNDNENDDIKGYSSSDNDDDNKHNIFYDNKNPYNSSKLSSRSLDQPVKKRRLMKNSFCESKDTTPCSSRTFGNFNKLSKALDSVKKWNIFSCNFENSFPAVSPSLHDDSVHGPKQRVEESNGEEIAWSDSDNTGDINNGESSAHEDSENPAVLSISTLPFSSQQYNTITEGVDIKIVSDIDEFDSDTEGRDLTTNITLHEQPSPSISPNTPTPTSPKVGETTNLCPPLDSAKKKKQKYLKSGLAEKLNKLLLRQKSEKSYWLHKLRQLRENDDNNGLSNRAEKTVTLKMICSHLDHSVYVIKCDVVAQDVISDRELPGQVTVLLDRDTRKQLDFNSTSSYLRIYPPWKVFDLPTSSTPVLLCITRCEVLESFDITINNSSTVEPFHVSEKQLDQSMEKIVRASLFHSDNAGSKTKEERTSLHARVDKTDESAKQAAKADGVILSRRIEDALGYQGLCVMDRVHFVARVQRVYWRAFNQRNSTLPCKSSLVSSIVERSKNFKRENVTSLCLLVQDSSGVFSEIILSSNDVLTRTDWQSALNDIQGQVMSFQSLLLVEHRKRKRRRDVFEFIDFLKSQAADTKDQTSDDTRRQDICFTFSTDETSILTSFPDDADFASYCLPSLFSTDDLNSNCSINNKRVHISGKLLYVIYKKDELYDNCHIKLFISPIFTNDTFQEPQVLAKVVHVSYRQRGKFGWGESSLAVGQFLSIEDAVVKKGSPSIFTTDHFSSIKIITTRSSFTVNQSTPVSSTNDLWRRAMSVPMEDERYDHWRSLPRAALPNLSVQTEQNTLVNFEGVIIDIDQTNAYSWFTCNECRSDDISEIPDNSLYICNSCGLDISSPVTNTHLEVYLKSVGSPSLFVKAKLLQSTISRLLPLSDAGSDELSEGYDVQCVLNKHVGPTSWHVLEKHSKDNKEDSKINFKLEEIDTNN